MPRFVALLVAIVAMKPSCSLVNPTARLVNRINAGTGEGTLVSAAIPTHNSNSDAGKQRQTEGNGFARYFDTRAFKERVASSSSPEVRQGLVFAQLRSEAMVLVESSPLLRSTVLRQVVDQRSLQGALATVLTDHLASPHFLPYAELQPLLVDLVATDGVTGAAVEDLLEITSKDPAVASSFLQPFLFYKGFHATAAQRCAHALWRRGDFASRCSALAMQGRTSEVFGVDVHPAATLGPGFFLDHASGVVVGETAVVGARCTMLHSVTLGASGAARAPGSSGRRHPAVGDDVLLGAGCTVLGPVSVGAGATVGAQAVVTQSVGAGCTVVGVNRVLALGADADAPAAAAEDPTAGLDGRFAPPAPVDYSFTSHL